MPSNGESPAGSTGDGEPNDFQVQGAGFLSEATRGWEVEAVFIVPKCHQDVTGLPGMAAIPGNKRE